MDIEEEFKELTFNVTEIEKQSEAYYTYYEEAIKLINSIKSKFNSQREQNHKNFQYVDQKNHEINKLCHEIAKLKVDRFELSKAYCYGGVFLREKAQRIIKEESQGNKGILKTENEGLSNCENWIDIYCGDWINTDYQLPDDNKIVIFESNMGAKFIGVMKNGKWFANHDYINPIDRHFYIVKWRPYPL